MSTPSSHEPGPAQRRTVGLVFAVALVLRAIHLFDLARSALPSVLLGDAWAYDRWASELAGGAWLGAEVFFQAPLYPHLLGLLYAVCGEVPWVMRALQALLGALSAVLACSATSRLVSRRAGLVAGLALACYGPAIWFDGLIQKASLGLFLTALFVELASRVGDGRRTRLAAAAGVTLGLLVLTRENAAVLWPVGVAWLAWGRAGDDPRSRRFVAAGVFTLSLVLTLAPVALRNSHLGGPLLPTSNAGVNFYIGNNSLADGRYTPLVAGRGHPQFERADAKTLAERELGRELAAGEVSAFWFGRAVEEIDQDTEGWGRLLAMKLALVWSFAEVMDAESIEVHRDHSGLLWVLWPAFGFGVLAALAGAGIWTTHRRWGELWWLALALSGLVVSIVAFFVTARFRLGLVPFLLPFAGAGAVSLVRGPFRRAAIVIFVVVLVACHWPIDTPGDPRATTYANVASALLRDDRADEALLWALEAVRAEPRNAGAHYTLAVALDLNGRPDDAREHYVESMRQERSFEADALAALGLIHAGRGELSLALDRLDAALERDPYAPRTHYNRALTLRRLGRPSAAIDGYGRALALDPDFADAHHNLAVVLEEEGSFEEAVASYVEALRADPERVAPMLRLAWIRATHPDEALRDGARAVELAERARVVVEKTSLEVLDVLAAAYAEAGRLEGALRLIEDAIDLAAELGIDDAERAYRARREIYRAGRPYRSSGRSSGG